MSSHYYDDLYTKVAKPTASYTITPKAASPTITVVPDPCLELLALLTESAIEILHEDTRVMVREG